MGWRRENGRVGVRNHVVILPLDDLSNAACEAVANNVKGTMAIPMPMAVFSSAQDLDLHFRTLIGIGSNPNVAAVVVIGIEDQWTDRVVAGIAKTGKPASVRHRRAWRHRDDRKGQLPGQALCSVGCRAETRGMLSLRSLGFDEMRRVRHHTGLRPARPSGICMTS